MEPRSRRVSASLRSIAASLTTCGWLAASILPAAAQQNPQTGGGEYTQQADGPAGGNFVVPLPEGHGLSPDLVRAKKLFVQRCSACHLPGLPIYQAYGPLLDRTTLEHKSRPALRRLILDGTPRMPGWKYTLRAEDVDSILAYLNTVTFRR